MIDADDVVYIAPLPDGPIMVLDGVSALIWQTITDPVGATDTEVAAHVAAATGQRPDDIAGHVTSFLDDLVRRGVIIGADD
ncbi:PqqD family protein [Microbacterium esteraromaticum]|uniref:PqqD family protein n=1 Tax=Microbacterium esteraromaticum TaxID=57043 RepID=UPI002368EAEC|nr:PqqD family protein [Microbacterium esteraromaticum]WDH79482.1 PqqD family protein [Microbacterium esteraromaticum]